MDASSTTLVRTLFDHLNAHDLGAMVPHAAEDEFQDLPMVGHIEGRDAVFEHFAAVLAAIPDIRGMDRFTIRDGKVASVFAAYDSMDFAIQSGPLPLIDSPAQRAMVHAINALTAVRRRLPRAA